MLYCIFFFFYLPTTSLIINANMKNTSTIAVTSQVYFGNTNIIHTPQANINTTNIGTTHTSEWARSMKRVIDEINKDIKYMKRIP